MRKDFRPLVDAAITQTKNTSLLVGEGYINGLAASFGTTVNPILDDLTKIAPMNADALASKEVLHSAFSPVRNADLTSGSAHPMPEPQRPQPGFGNHGPRHDLNNG